MENFAFVILFIQYVLVFTSITNKILNKNIIQFIIETYNIYIAKVMFFPPNPEIQNDSFSEKQMVSLLIQTSWRSYSRDTLRYNGYF